MLDYAFGAGGFQLGERVEILLTGQRGILTSEVIHVSGCNTYEVLMPGVKTLLGKKKATLHDHLLLRKLDPGESMIDASIELTVDNTFSPKGTDVNAEWIRAAIDEKKEFVPEIDDGVGVEEITIFPGMEVWNKYYGNTMIVTHIYRDIYCKELRYGVMHMSGDTEVYTYCRSYALVPLENKIIVPPATKYGSVFEDGRAELEVVDKLSENRYGMLL